MVACMVNSLPKAGSVCFMIFNEPRTIIRRPSGVKISASLNIYTSAFLVAVYPTQWSTNNAQNKYKYLDTFFCTLQDWPV